MFADELDDFMEMTFRKNHSEIIRVNPLNPRKSASYFFVFVTYRTGGSLTRGYWC